MNQSEIAAIIPHKDPFIYVSRVIDYTYPTHIHAQLDIDPKNPIFKGHFPNNPVFPGVLMLESLAQTGAILLMMDESKRDLTPYFGGVDKCRFKRIVRPGEMLDLTLDVIHTKGPIGKAEAKATVNGELACKAILTFAVK